MSRLICTKSSEIKYRLLQLCLVFKGLKHAISCLYFFITCTGTAIIKVLFYALHLFYSILIKSSFDNSNDLTACLDQDEIFIPHESSY